MQKYLTKQLQAFFPTIKSVIKHHLSNEFSSFCCIFIVFFDQTTSGICAFNKIRPLRSMKLFRQNVKFLVQCELSAKIRLETKNCSNFLYGFLAKILYFEFNWLLIFWLVFLRRIRFLSATNSWKPSKFLTK